ncbi:PHP domain-containing protein [Aminipila luticellarii]|uniref:PHP domain-containing protein n=1 Tax=Aminipila luticellarii TaxID=2507160 RepID=A0A410PT49_9FIRM|nr:PHP domain-containing protein [Aminipila luticellarii]QAT42048.1 PHP domain-containing protein [Aminipila luticellarii]
MKNKVDYHLHTYYSDGSMSPTEMVKRAKDLEYTEIAITDHDGIDGVREAQIAGDALEVNVLSGIELAAELKTEKFKEAVPVHILGYRMDIKNKELNAELEKIKEKRKIRNEKLLAVLKEMGYELSEEDFPTEDDREYIGKPLIARAMVKRGYIDHVKEAFEPGRLLEAPAAKAVKKEKISAERAIALIKGAGGIAVLAHPMKIKELGTRGSQEFYEKLDALTREMKKMGLKGIECFHPAHTKEESLYLVGLAEKYHLHITEGSDYHGPDFEK